MPSKNDWKLSAYKESIEHNMEGIKSADWIIDLGPEGGSEGGQIIATGSPEEITKIKGSHTAMKSGIVAAEAIVENIKNKAERRTTENGIYILKMNIKNKTENEN